MSIYLSEVLKKMAACNAAVRWVKKRKGVGTLEDTFAEALKQRPEDVRWLVNRLPYHLQGQGRIKAEQLREALHSEEKRLNSELNSKHNHRWRYTEAQWRAYNRDYNDMLNAALSKVVTYEKLLPLLVAVGK